MTAMTEFDDLEGSWTQDPEFTAMWDAQMLSYPTITRKVDPAVGEDPFNYFDVKETGDYDTDWAHGEALAVESLFLAGQYREADSCAMLFILTAAFEDLRRDDEASPGWAAHSFIDTVIDQAMIGVRNRRSS